MYGQRTTRTPMGMGGGGPAPRDLLVLIGVLFATFSLQHFSGTAIIPTLLSLTPMVWKGFVWQLATYAFSGYGGVSLWFLLSLLMIFWFGRDVYRTLGRRGFWTLLGWGIGTASLVAVAVQLVLTYVLGFPQLTTAFTLMQGQQILLAILVAAFAVIYGHATILLMFVIPIQAKWFIGLELVFAFMGLLGTKDWAGFFGICAAVGITYSMLTGRGPRRLLREWRLRIEQQVLKARMKRLQRKRGLRVVRGEGEGSRGNGGGDVKRGPWVH